MIGIYLAVQKKKSMSTDRRMSDFDRMAQAAERLEYFADEGKFVLTGGSPSIFDAEHGKITGDSLTFYNRDDRVLVEGGNSSPTVTQTRVAR